MSDMTGAVVVDSPDRRLAMHVSLSFKRTDGEVSSVFLNSSNIELAPARVRVNLLTNFPFIASRRNMPAFAVKGDEITNAQAQEVELEESHMHITALPRCCPIDYHKTWVEGDTLEQGFEETFESEFYPWAIARNRFF